MIAASFGDVIKKLQTVNRLKAKTLKVGFVPLVDCAPLVVARELGLFAKYGLSVELSRELGWASIRDKVIYGELDAAQAVAGMVFAAAWGLGSIPCECLTALVLNSQGNAITLSNRLWTLGVRDVASLRALIQHRREEKPLVFGVVFPYSSHHFLLRQWLKSGGIDPDRDVQIVVVPPPQMFSNLKAGNLDGYCVGEPWNTVAVQARVGWCPVTSSGLAPLHPEKVLMVRADFAATRHDEHVALVSALLEACAWCQKAGNRREMIRVLARPAYVNAPARAIEGSFEARFDCGHGQYSDEGAFHLFFGGELNAPTADKAAWILHQMRVSKLLEPLAWSTTPQETNLFRCDIYDAAWRLFSKKRILESIDHEKQILHSY